MRHCFLSFVKKMWGLIMKNVARLIASLLVTQGLVGCVSLKYMPAYQAFPGSKPTEEVAVLDVQAEANPAWTNVDGPVAAIAAVDGLSLGEVHSDSGTNEFPNKAMLLPGKHDVELISVAWQNLR